MSLSVTNSPFTAEQAKQLSEVIATLTPEQKVWLSGYLIANQQTIQTNSSVQSEQLSTKAEAVIQSNEQEIEPTQRSITVLYGSETGNAQGVAEIFSERLTNLGHNVVISSMDTFKTKELKKVEDLFIVTSTHGEGDPPDNALEFHEFLHSRKAPKLEGVRFSVLALGDQTYEFFCQTGKDFDKN